MTMLAETTDAQLSLDLSPEEAHTLERCERVIEEGRQTFLKVGTALLEIRDQRLYRQGYPSFEEYLAKKWQMGRSTGYRMMEAAAVVADLSPIGDEQKLPANEAQARELGRLEPEERQEAWKETVETAEASGSDVTAATVREVVEAKLPERPAAPPGPTPAPAPAAALPAPVPSPVAATAPEPPKADVSTPPAAVVPAPAPAPAALPASVPMQMCVIPSHEAEWLNGHGMTVGVAMSRLRELLDEKEKVRAQGPGECFVHFSGETGEKLTAIVESYGKTATDILTRYINRIYAELAPAASVESSEEWTETANE